MVNQEEHSPEKVVSQAKAILAAIEDRRQTRPVGGSDTCYQAHHAAAMAVRALCSHYGQNCPETLSLGAMLDVLAGGIIRVPPEILQARVLERYAAGSEATPEGTPPSAEEMRQSVTQAQNLVAWVEVVMLAGKPI